MLKPAILSLLFSVVGGYIGAEKDDNSPITYDAVQADCSCYVNAVGYRDALEVQAKLLGKHIEGKILYVQMVKTEGHALYVFKFDGRWRAYDSRIGTKDLGVFEGEPTPEQAAKIVDCQYINPKWME